jgi:outer membrane beta-barrel protein
MSDLEYRPNPRLFSRIGSFSFTAYTGGYAFDRKSNSLVLGGRLGYYVFEYVEVEGSVGWTHVVRPAEIVESLFDLTLEEEDFHMLFYAVNLNLKLLPGRQVVPFLTGGGGSSIMQGETEASYNFGAGCDFFARKTAAFRFEFRTYNFDSGVSESRRDNTNFEFSVGSTFLF